MSLALIMEDIGAISLRKHLQTSRLDLLAFFSIAIQLVETLGELHQKGVIHRDLKPGNILIHPGTEQVKIIDFGTAVLLSRKGQNNLMPNTSVGTLAYMSPEQIGRMNLAVDHRSDYYSLGVVLYEILTGQLPLQADNPHSVGTCPHCPKTGIPWGDQSGHSPVGLRNYHEITIQDCWGALPERLRAFG